MSHLLLLVVLYSLLISAKADKVIVSNCPGFNDYNQNTTVDIISVDIEGLCGSPPFVLTGGSNLIVQIFSNFDDFSGKIQLNYALRELRHGSIPVEVTEESWIPLESGNVIPSDGSVGIPGNGQAEIPSSYTEPNQTVSTEITSVRRNVSMAEVQTVIPVLLSTIARALELQFVVVDRLEDIIICKQMFVFLLEPPEKTHYKRRLSAFPYFHYNPYRSLSIY